MSNATSSHFSHLSPESQALAAKVKTAPDGTVTLPNGTPVNRGPKGVKVTTVTKKKPGDKSKAAPANPTPGSGPSLGERGLKVMKELSKRAGGTLADVVKWTKLDERAAYHHLWCLRRDGFVRSSRSDEVGVVFELTASGRKAIKKG